MCAAPVGRAVHGRVHERRRALRCCAACRAAWSPCSARCRSRRRSRTTPSAPTTAPRMTMPPPPTTWGDADSLVPRHDGGHLASRWRGGAVGGRGADQRRGGGREGGLLRVLRHAARYRRQQRRWDHRFANSVVAGCVRCCLPSRGKTRPRRFCRAPIPTPPMRNQIRRRPSHATGRLPARARRPRWRRPRRRGAWGRCPD